MQFLFSGEGATDLGVCSSDVNMCRGRDFLHGPWAMIVDQLVERRQEYSPLDSTASAGRGLWAEKRKSMLDGFEREGFRRGVPMLPNPKSEAWLLCAVKKHYMNCASLEDRSGNDDSPYSLKMEVQRHFGHRPSREQLCQMVTDGKIDALRIDMPSFRAFTDRLDDVI